MTEAPDQCAHEVCTCAATEGEYRGDYCREHSGSEEELCACDRDDCAGTIARAAGEARSRATDDAAS